MSNQIDLDALQALCDAATEGPWSWWTSCSFRRLSSDATGHDGDVMRGTVIYVAKQHDGVLDVVCRDADKEFIATSRTAMPALIARVRELERAVADEREACARVAAEIGDELHFSGDEDGYRGAANVYGAIRSRGNR
jgi:hypothetical protein